MLAFFNPTKMLRRWDVTSFCVQFEHWLPWYKEEGIEGEKRQNLSEHRELLYFS